MSACSDGEFTCSNGDCVTMEQRCDQLPHCRDKSDEEGCQNIHLENGYTKEVAPVTLVADSNRSILPVPVKLNIRLFKVVDINEEDHSIELQIKISLKWKDNRLTFHNLKKDLALNAVKEDKLKLLWLPLVIYTNTDQKQTTRLGESWEWSTSVLVRREGSFTRSGLEEVDEVEIYRGGENTLSMQQTYTHEFQCVYKLTKYPFDTQVGNISLTSVIFRFAQLT